jgi:hypothetical protein
VKQVACQVDNGLHGFISQKILFNQGWGETCPLGTPATIWPIVPTPLPRALLTSSAMLKFLGSSLGNNFVVIVGCLRLTSSGCWTLTRGEL